MTSSERCAININVGVLGHVDSGKTSLCRVLSQRGSTAAFDKHPQSQERGITIDLGFSTFSYSGRRYTLVDCPGHSSLIRTVIGGAQIIDIMLLVLDATKGFQTQTAECLVIGEICCDRLAVVLNKVDLLKDKPGDLEKLRKKVSRTLESTKFKGAELVDVSAVPYGDSLQPAHGIEKLKEVLFQAVPLPQRTEDGALIFCVDHCFLIKGRGTILTGTITQGSLSSNASIEIPSLKVQRKIKTLQVFGEPVMKAIQGERVGVCVTQLDAKQFERGVVCSPGHLKLAYAAILPVTKVSYFKQAIRSGSKFHITAFHDTAMAKITMFCSKSQHIDLKDEMNFIEELDVEECKSQGILLGLIEFERPIVCGVGSLLLASKLDADVHTKSCRLAFYGRLIRVYATADYHKTLSELRVFKTKCKFGVVERLVNENEVIVKNMFKKGTNIQLFCGMTLRLSSGETALLQTAFGQNGKVKVQVLSDQLSDELSKLRIKKDKTNDEELISRQEPIRATLHFKKFVFDPNKQMTHKPNADPYV